MARSLAVHKGGVVHQLNHANNVTCFMIDQTWDLLDRSTEDQMSDV